MLRSHVLQETLIVDLTQRISFLKASTKSTKHNYKEIETTIIYTLKLYTDTIPKLSQNWPLKLDASNKLVKGHNYALWVQVLRDCSCRLNMLILLSSPKQKLSLFWSNSWIITSVCKYTERFANDATNLRWAILWTSDVRRLTKHQS